MTRERFDDVLKGVLVLLIFTLVVLIGLLVHEYRQLRLLEKESTGHSFLSSISHRGPLGPQDAALVQSWMTFDYVSRVFRIPADYFKTSLSIDDARYPRVSIAAYAEKKRLDTASFLSDVQTAIRQYTPTAASP